MKKISVIALSVFMLSQTAWSSQIAREDEFSESSRKFIDKVCMMHESDVRARIAVLEEQDVESFVDGKRGVSFNPHTTEVLETLFGGYRKIQSFFSDALKSLEELMGLKENAVIEFFLKKKAEIFSLFEKEESNEPKENEDLQRGPLWHQKDSMKPMDVFEEAKSEFWNNAETRWSVLFFNPEKKLIDPKESQKRLFSFSNDFSEEDFTAIGASQPRSPFTELLKDQFIDFFKESLKEIVGKMIIGLKDTVDNWLTNPNLISEK